MGLGTLFGKLFGGADGNSHKATATSTAEVIDYKGFAITATPIKEGGQYRTAGTISREIDGQLRSAQFIRADNHSDQQAAISHSERKGQQIVDEQGDAMFERAHI